MKYAFVSGLALQFFAQILFSVHSESINLLEPIDFIHWILLVGVVLIIPYTMVFSEGVYRSIGSVVTLIGCACNIGMCAIDFVLWTFRDNVEQRNELVSHLMDEPWVWLVFFSVGPAFYVVGLAIQALGYLRRYTSAAAAVLVGSSLVGIGGLILPEVRAIFLTGYLIFITGLILLVLKEDDTSKNLGT